MSAISCLWGFWRLRLRCKCKPLAGFLIQEHPHFSLIAMNEEGLRPQRTRHILIQIEYSREQ